MKKILLSTLKFYPTMISVLGLIFVDGINIGVQTSTLVHLIPKTDDEKQDNFYSGICLLSSGVGCFIGGYLGGKLCDIFPIKKIAYSGIFLYILACTLIFIASFIEVFTFSLLASFVLGFEFYYIEGCLLVICSRIFQGVPESFAIVKQFHCISFILYEIVAMTTSNSI